MEQHKKLRQKEKYHEKKLSQRAKLDMERKMNNMIIDATFNHQHYHQSDFDLKISDADFPSVVNDDTNIQHEVDSHSICSFRNVCASNGFFPTLSDSVDDKATASPWGKASKSNVDEGVASWGPSQKSSSSNNINGGVGKKKNKKRGEKIVLFSTGGGYRS